MRHRPYFGEREAPVDRADGGGIRHRIFEGRASD
jgi:hypothetical protein